MATKSMPGFVSRLFFCWTLPKLLQGRKRELEPEDISFLPVKDETEILFERINKNWAKELTKERPSLRRALMKAYSTTIITTFCAVVFQQCIIRVSTPILIGFLIRYSQRQVSNSVGILLIVLFVLSNFISAFIQQWSWFRLGHLGMKLRVSVTALIYQKVFRLTQESLASTGIGQLTNIMSNDVNRFDGLKDIPYVFTVPLQILTLTAILWQYMGVSCLTGVFVLLLMLPLMGMLGRRLGKLRAGVAAITDRRIRLVSEVLGAITVIKMSIWESLFADLLTDTRSQEVKCIHKRNRIQGVNFSLFNVASRFSVFFTFLTLSLLNLNLSAEVIYVTLSMYVVVTSSASIYFPQGMAGLSEVLVSITRIQEMLLLEEKAQGEIKLAEKVSPPCVKVKNFNASWNSGSRLVLENISFSVENAELVGIVGPVGSGKTSLLEGILGELSNEGGSVEVSGKIAYVPQEAWTFQGTIRENILFGLAYDSNWYWTVIEATTLDRDFQSFPLKDSTPIGDNGISLSGGQRARISLARAVYSKADIYLLDDPLSAVDAKVGRDLMDKCIRTVLRSKCVLLVTHQIHHLKEANFIITLNQGRIDRRTRYEELIRTDSNLSIQSVNAPLSIDDLVEVKPAQSARQASTKRGDYRTFEKAISGAEDQTVGSVDWKIFLTYMRSGNSLGNITIIIILIIGTQVVMSGSDMWLTEWAENVEDELASDINIGPSPTDMAYLYAYGGLVAGIFLLSLVETYKIFKAALSSARNLHNGFVSSVLSAPMKFFQENPAGRILNRYSNDIGKMDENLPPLLYVVTSASTIVFGSFVIIIITQPLLIVPTIFLIMYYYILIRVYVKPSSTIRRLEGISRSPILGLLSTTLSGLSVVRAYGVQDYFTRKFNNFQNAHSGNFYFYLASSRWLQLSVELAADFYLALLVIYFLFLQSGPASGTAFGLAISSALALTLLVSPFMGDFAEVVNLLINVERVIEYTNIPAEANTTSTMKYRDSWPESGGIEFSHLTISYVKGRNILSDITCLIHAGEKIGIVGRTGAGKSSMISALFRLVEPISGQILIDNLDIGKIGLKELRGKLSVIPQSPILFEATLRKNLDPFENNSDEELWRALEHVQMKESLDVRGLDLMVSEGGSNFSQGERQLLCLARSILEDNKIIVLDEATANVDKKTDSIIQKCIRTEFEKCTVLTIAHRLETVIDANRILVLDKGFISEFDEPWKLLENEESFFSRLVENTGINQSKKLRDLAIKAKHKFTTHL